MNSIFAKLNYRGQPEIEFSKAPDEFVPVMDEMRSLADIVTDPQQIQQGGFILAVVKTQQQVDELTAQLAAKVQGDGLLWFAYPKGTSKRHKCDRATLRFNHDTG